MKLWKKPSMVNAKLITPSMSMELWSHHIQSPQSNNQPPQTQTLNPILTATHHPMRAMNQEDEEDDHT
jgi:hypothetical protein